MSVNKKTDCSMFLFSVFRKDEKENQGVFFFSIDRKHQSLAIMLKNWKNRLIKSRNRSITMKKKNYTTILIFKCRWKPALGVFCIQSVSSQQQAEKKTTHWCISVVFFLTYLDYTGDSCWCLTTPIAPGKECWRDHFSSHFRIPKRLIDWPNA